MRDERSVHNPLLTQKAQKYVCFQKNMSQVEHYQSHTFLNKTYEDYHLPGSYSNIFKS